MREQHDLTEKMLAVRGLVLDVDGVLTDGGLRYGPDGEALKVFHTRDDVGLRLAQAAGWPILVITAMDTPMVATWARERDITELHQGIRDKRSTLQAAAQRVGLDLQQAAYVGDDLLDLPSMDLCGLTAAPRDANLLVRQKVDLVLELGGGRGAVRELVERVLERQGCFGQVLRTYYAQRGCAEVGSLVPPAEEPTTEPKIGFRR